MDINKAKPRINGSMIPKFIGSVVTLVGRTQGSSAGASTLQLETGDKQQVTVLFSQPLDEPLTLYVEVVGEVGPDCSISVLTYVNWGDNFDLDTYNEVMQLLPQFPVLYPTQ